MRSVDDEENTMMMGIYHSPLCAIRIEVIIIIILVLLQKLNSLRWAARRFIANKYLIACIFAFYSYKFLNNKIE